ncbi:MAG: (Fe-S)-binding protein, partial [Acidimicrobiia bacterium]|nr:(Fe-S)-binding protein [Acidimicrobiia bacterium]
PVATKTVTLGAAITQKLRIGRFLPGFARRGLEGLRRLDPQRQTWRGRSAPAIGGRRGTVALLSGCVMDRWFGAVHDATVGVLTQAGFDVVAPDTQTCCGALAAHDGEQKAARRLAARNEAAFAPYDVVISNSAGCTAHLKEYGHWVDGSGVEAKVADVTEFVAALIDDGTLPELEGDGVPVAIQDPCHLRHAQRIVAPPRTLVRGAGFAPVEIDALGLCCGAAGIYSVLHPSTSADLGRQKAEQVAASGASVVASANPGCEMQLRSHLDTTVRVVHPIELYWEALNRDR